MIGDGQRLLDLAMLSGEAVTLHQHITLTRFHLGKCLLDLGTAALAFDGTLPILLELLACLIDLPLMRVKTRLRRFQLTALDICRLLGQQPLLFQRFDLHLEMLDLRPCFRNLTVVAFGPRTVLVNALFVDLDDLLCTDVAVICLRGLFGQFGNARFSLMDQCMDTRRLRLGLGHKLLMRHQLLSERMNRCIQFADADVERGQTAARKKNIEPAQFIAQRAVLLRLARLALERADLTLDLANHIGETQQVRFGLIDFA